MNSIEATIFDVELLQLNQHYQHLVLSSADTQMCNDVQVIETTQALTDLNRVLTDYQIQVVHSDSPETLLLSDGTLRFSSVKMTIENKKALWLALTRYFDEHTSIK